MFFQSSTNKSLREFKLYVRIAILTVKPNENISNNNKTVYSEGNVEYKPRTEGINK